MIECPRCGSRERDYAMGLTPGSLEIEASKPGAGWCSDGWHGAFARNRVNCPACQGAGGAQRIVYWDRSDPNACYPDFDECGACEGEGIVPPEKAEEIEADLARQETAMEASFEERERWACEDEFEVRAEFGEEGP